MSRYPENDYRDYLIHNDMDMKYGLPRKKKYPMPDRDHVMSAIKFFNYASPSDEKELARNIIARIKEYGITGINVGENNRFGKYYKPKVYLEHSAKGQQWQNHKYIAIKKGRYIYPKKYKIPGLRETTPADKLKLALQADVKNSIKKAVTSKLESNPSGLLLDKRSRQKKSIFAKYLSKKKYGGLSTTKKPKRSGSSYSGKSRKF